MLPKWMCVVLISVFVYSLAMKIDESAIRARIELIELDYEEACQNASNAEWLFLDNPTNSTLITWKNAQNGYADFKKIQKEEIATITMDMWNDSILTYKYGLLENPGDALLDESHFTKLTAFAGQAELLRASAKYNFKMDKNSREDVDRMLSRNGKVEDKRDAWTSWHHQLEPLAANFSQNLALVTEAASANGARDVSHYWEELSGYRDGYEQIKSMWEQISSLHKKLVNFVHSRLAKKYGISIKNETIPAYLLGSLQGYDWTAIVQNVAPHPNLTYSIRKNLWKKKLVGKSLYKSASTMGHAVLNQVPLADFWKKSSFDNHCPSRLFNFCERGIMGVSACWETSIDNLISAHKNVGKVLVNQMMAENTPVLNIANRYSGLEESIGELFAILSVSPAQLTSLGLADESFNNDQLQITSLMITALNVLPRLAYYLSTDLWRIDALENKISTPDDLTGSWWKHRLLYENIVPDSAEVPSYLDDSYVIRNKPYLPKFVGIVFAFQVYEYLMDSTEIRYEKLVDNPVNHNLVKLIKEGGAGEWSTAVQKYLEIENVSIDPLQSFFFSLEEYLDSYSSDNDDLISAEQEAELEELKKRCLEEIHAPSTTSTVRTTTMKKTTTASIPKRLNEPTTTKEPEYPPDMPQDGPHVTNESTTKRSDNLETTESDETQEASKINPSKAAWAVAAVLLGTVTICIIAIFGRRRCRKTPKNRRYV